MNANLLHHGLQAAALRDGTRPAVIDEARDVIAYRDLDLLAGTISRRLRSAGVRPGDFVAVALPKSPLAVAALGGILRCGAAYVPLDPESPAPRTAQILRSCQPRVVLASPSIDNAWMHSTPGMCVLTLDGVSGAIVPAMTEVESLHQDCTVAEDAPAYVLHTSGSTGTPKGVVVSHRAAMVFVRWAAAEFGLSVEDRVASIAPFHFDLSVFDVFASQLVGATVVLFGSGTGRNPRLLAQRVAEERITTLYTTPSVLMALQQYGRLERFRFGHLRRVMFAGEVYPVHALADLMRRWPHVRFHNLFGPTETNVCTWYSVPSGHLPVQPLPIGGPCPHYRIRLVPDVDMGRGELLVSGDGLMTCYLNQPDETRCAFDVDEDGTTWYRTGDIVSWRSDGFLYHHGRRDRMVKRRGFRIELGEIEACLRRHEAVATAAVVAVTEGMVTTAIQAYVVPSAPVDQVQLRRHCARELPAYMVPDRFAMLDALPITSTGKTDLRTLERLAAARSLPSGGAA